jgi:hypothetical protein
MRTTRYRTQVLVNAETGQVPIQLFHCSVTRLLKSQRAVRSTPRHGPAAV